MIPTWAHLNKPFNKKVFYSGPFIDEKDMKAITDTLFNGQWFTCGEKVAEFEKAFSKKFDSKYSVMVNSGSSANLLMIAALKKYYGWKDRDKILISTVGFPTTVSAIILNNLEPVFMDIELDTLNMDLSEKSYYKYMHIENIKAIFISPVLGNPPPIQYWKTFENSRIKVVLDGCDSLGTKAYGSSLNIFSDVVSNSFYPTHTITTGEGGMISSNNKEIINIARSMSWWGRDCICSGSNNMLTSGSCNNRFSDWLGTGDIIDHRYIFSNIGYNLKPLDLQGALGLSQLEKFDEIEERRKVSFSTISTLYKKYIPNIRIPEGQYECDVSWFAVPIICQTKEVKEKLVKYLEDNGIQTRHYFAGNILLHPAYKHLGNYKDYPNANEVLKRVFFVGCAPHYNDEVFNYIESILKEFV